LDSAPLLDQLFCNCQFFRSRWSVSRYSAGWLARVEPGAGGSCSASVMRVPHGLSPIRVAIILPSTTGLRWVRVSPLDINIPLCRFSYLSWKLKDLAPSGRRDPLHKLVKAWGNIELDHRCHSHPPKNLLLTFDNWREAPQMPKLWLKLTNGVNGRPVVSKLSNSPWSHWAACVCARIGDSAETGWKLECWCENGAGSTSRDSADGEASGFGQSCQSGHAWY